MTHIGLEVGDLNLRLANLRVDGALALAAEIDGALINITRAGNALSLPAPADVDDLIQNRRAADVRAVVDQLRERGDAESFAVAQSTFAPLVTRPQKSSVWDSTIRRTLLRRALTFPKRPLFLASS